MNKTGHQHSTHQHFITIPLIHFIKSQINKNGQLSFFLALFLAILLPQGLHAQDLSPRLPLEEVDLLMLPRQNNEKLIQTELAQRQPGVPPRFAVSFPTAISPLKEGNWEELSDGSSIWRFRLLSPAAHSINLGFGEFYLPEGSKLTLYSPDYKNKLGPFTVADNDDHREFWTPILAGDEMVVELRLPSTEKKNLSLKITTINHDFMGFSTFVSSGSCNLDVICGIDDGWEIVEAYRDIIQSVGVYSTGGSTFCTGFLVNNAREDCTPFFMTADHCGLRSGNAASLVVYWNFENKSCRAPNSTSSGGAGDGILNDFNSGAILRARSSATDFTLLELDDDVSETANAFFAGWDANTNLPIDTVIAIHHPSTDEKRISFSFEEIYKGNQNGQGVANGGYLVVPEWSIGTTEGGSSGCPFFDKNKRVVGQLFGGAASCNNNSYDSFGWLAISWEGDGTPETRLRDWLDPDNSGKMAIDGRSQNSCNFNLETSATDFQFCGTTEFNFELSPSENFVEEVTLTAQGLPTGVSVSFSINPVQADTFSTATIEGLDQLAPGSYTFSISGTDGTETAVTDFNFSLSETLPSVPILSAPIDAAANQGTAQTFSWDIVPNAQTYEWQLSTSPNFENIVAQTTNLVDPSILNQDLVIETTYYWRARGINSCGEGTWSDVFSLTTSGAYCLVATTDVPINIISSNPNIARSTIDVAQLGQIASLSLSLDIKHSYITDLKANLISPSGTSITLFSNPGDNTSFQGCSNDDLLLSFSDDATQANSVLANRCADTSPAVSGNFMPQQAFSNLAGEEANGVWTLEVIDEFDEDGGEISSWSLDICTTYPATASLVASLPDISICPDESFSLQLIIGAGFNGNALQLSTEELPVGTAIEFAQNPATPASIINVTGSGFNTPGTLPLTFSVTDGNITAMTTVDLLINNLPADLVPLQPTNAATLVGVAPALGWSTNPAADSYQVTVSTAEDLSNPIIQTGTSNTVINIGELIKGQTYYWQVAATNECGTTLSERWSFTTVPDLSFTTNPATIAACPGDSPQFSFEVDPDFLGPVDLTYTILPNSNVTLESELSFVGLTPGQNVAINITNWEAVMAGDYTIQLSLSDGTLSSSTTVDLAILSIPDAPALTAPADLSNLVAPPSLLSWETVAGAINYSIEIASDANFENILESGDTDGTSYAPNSIVDGGNYFWRVTANNSCGTTAATPFQFTYMPNAIQEIGGTTISLFPNPTIADVNIQLSNPLTSTLQITLHRINGQALQQWQIPSGVNRQSVSLTGLPAGVYLLRLKSEEGQVIARIIKSEG